jgi:putative transposase
MTDALYSGQRFRALTILDEGNREGLAIEVATSIPSPRVVRVLEDLVALHGRPRALRTDNGPEFIAQPLVDWQARSERVHRTLQPELPHRSARCVCL